MSPTDDTDVVARIDDAMRVWRQGDLALDETVFVHLADTDTPLTPAAREAGSGGLQTLQSATTGLMVITQTCDLVRHCLNRPYVEVAPLVELSEDEYRTVARERIPSRATLHCLSAPRLAADLDRSMTVEKAVVAEWARTPGCDDDAEMRRLAEALARKRSRFAFPDDFTKLAGPLRKRLLEKHGRRSEEGDALRELTEIRVAATPNWQADRVTLLFWFVQPAGSEHAVTPDRLEYLLGLMKPAGRYILVEGLIATLDDMSATDYVASDRLELDFLSAVS